MREPFEKIQALFRNDRIPDSPVLHAVLFRVCAARIGELRNCRRQPVWRQRAAELRNSLEISERGGRTAWLTAIRDLLLQRRPQPAERSLVACSAALQNLDEHHRKRRADIGHRTFALSEYLGPGTAATVFLPPPMRPISSLIQDPLVRGRGDLKNDLRTYLDLWWYLVALDDYPITPVYHELDAAVSEVLAERVVRSPEDLTVGLATPFSKLRFQIESDPGRCDPIDGIPYRFVGISAEHRREAESNLETIFAACDANRVDVLCFPELTLDNDLLRHLSTLLKRDNDDDYPALVVAGSFHLQGDKCWQNRATVLDGWGNTLFEQAKCVAFKLPPARASTLGKEGMRLLGIDERGGYEDIDVGSEVHIVDTPLGRLAAPICLDYCGDEVRELLIDSGVNFLLVPAMTQRMKPFHRQAEALGTRSQAVSFAVNSSWLLRQLDLRGKELERELLMGYLPRRGGLKLTAETARRSSDLHLFRIRVLLE